MAGKRSKGDGSITFREGREKPWEARSTRRGGRAAQFQYFATQEEAAAWLRATNGAIDSNTYLDPTKVSVAQWLARWLEVYVQPSVRVRTYEGYHSIARLHIVPLVGKIPLQQLSPSDVQAMLNRRAKEGKSQRTLQYILGTLRTALKQAVHDELVSRNVAEAVKAPRSTKTKQVKTALSHEEIDRLLQAIHAPRVKIAVRLMLGTGVRVGELLALSWENIDFAGKALYVTQAVTNSAEHGILLEQPKTASSVRRIPLSASLLQELQSWKAQQAEERLLAGERWNNLGAVCTMDDGRRMRRELISVNLKAASSEAGVTCTPHTLRHTFCSLLIERGIELKTVQELMGHSTARMVMEIYAHSNDDAKRRAIDALGL